MSTAVVSRSLARRAGAGHAVVQVGDAIALDHYRVSSSTGSPVKLPKKRMPFPSSSGTTLT